MNIRTGIGFDSHRLVEGRKLVLGGVEFQHNLGLDGHSDADVLSHAIMDALLGAVADGDIGMHFPDTDPKWKDANSMDLLKAVGGRIGAKDAEVINIDSTIITEAPKLASYILNMRENIAGALSISVDSVSVKATTAEQMGSLGRGEGIAVMAVATVKERDEG